MPKLITTFCSLVPTVTSFSFSNSCHDVWDDIFWYLEIFQTVSSLIFLADFFKSDIVTDIGIGDRGQFFSTFPDKRKQMTLIFQFLKLLIIGDLGMLSSSLTRVCQANSQSERCQKTEDLKGIARLS